MATRMGVYEETDELCPMCDDGETCLSEYSGTRELSCDECGYIEEGNP